MGKLVITSNNNVVGELKIYSKSNTDMISGKLYTDADASTSLSIHQYGDHIAWDTYLAISDTSGLGATLTIRYYYPNGTIAVTEIQTVPPNGMYQDVPMSDGKNGRPKLGRVEITSNHLVNGEYRLYNLGIGGITSNKLYTSTDKRTSFTVPQYGDHIGWDTYMAISDASGLGATLTIRYYYPNGTLRVKETQTVPPNGVYQDVPMSDGKNGRPTTGKLEITSDNIIFGEMRIYSLSGRGLMSESLFIQPDISNTVIIPYYGNNTNFGTYVNLADVSGFNTPVRVDYHYLNGTLAKTENPVIPANGLLGWVASDGTSGRPIEGNIVISTT
ncbi:Uncharacterised protein [uncultured archaeon]|nr:Uncharacterised protein [uncultured archaeon]